MKVPRLGSILAALAAYALFTAVAGARVPVGPRLLEPNAAGVRCSGGVQHPLNVRVTALDPVARGAAVRLVVSASSAVALDQVEVRLTSTGGAANLGGVRSSLGPLDPGQVRQAQFMVSVPSNAVRTLVQFQVFGAGPNGNLTRGGCYNLLPDGPLESGRLVVTPQGRHFYEVRAGRID